MEWRRWIYALSPLIRTIVRRGRVEHDLDEELSFHVAMQTRANVHRGMSTAEAGRHARHAIGGVEQVKERSRDVRPLRWVQDLAQDLRYARRSLRRTPGFTAITVLTLALGIGANTALFSVISAVLLRPLAYPDGGRLVRLWSTLPTSTGLPRATSTGLPRVSTAMPDYREWRRENRTLEDLGAFIGAGYAVTGTDRPELLVATRMTASVWTVLQSQPQRGRVFSAAEEQWGGHRVAVISNGLWQRRFGGDPQAIGRSLELDGQPHAIVGVMPASFRFPAPLQELWVPLSFVPGDDMNTRSNRSADLLGRLKPGITLAQAQADLSTIAERVRHQVPENAAIGVTLAGWQEFIVGPVRPMLLLLLGAVALVLLIASVNVANLLLARATTREHELAVRVTLGAGRGRLVRQLLTESLALSSLSAVLSVGLAYGLIRTIPLWGPIGVPRLREVTLDTTVVGFAVALALLTGLAFGIWPARYGGRLGVMGHLKESARTFAGGRLRARHLLVAAEVSLSLVLLIGAALLVLSLKRVVQVDPGFQADHLFTAIVNLPPLRYGNDQRTQALIRQVVDGASELPGIRAIGATTAIPLGSGEWTKYFSIEGRPAARSLAEVPSVRYRQVTPGYFRAMGATIRRGRPIVPQDVTGQPPVAVINETLARRFWPDGDPIGAHISMNPPPSLVPERIREQRRREGIALPPPPLTVVGVVGDFRQNGLENETNPEVFVPHAQVNGEFLPTYFLVARTAGDPLAVTNAIQAVVSNVDPNLPLANVRTMESRLSDSLAQRRFAMQLLSGLAAVAFAVAVVGLYGVMTYTVNQRRRELGVRAALGATAADSVRLVMGDGLRMTALGVTIGLPLAGALSRLMSSQLFHVSAIDPVVYALVSVVVVIVACVACGFPAFRAARIDPTTTLRWE